MNTLNLSTSTNFRPEGLVTISAIRDSTGRKVTLEQAIKYGWLQGRPQQALPLSQFGDCSDEIAVGHNTFTDVGRQCLAFAMGFRSPIQDFVISYFEVGTGLASSKVSDVALENPVTLSGGSTKKQIDAVDFPVPFIARVAITLGYADAVGYLLTELGLFSGNGTLISRKTNTGINKTSDWSPTLQWRIRF